MTRIRRSLVAAIAAGILLATAAVARAETFTLSLKRRETKSARFDPTSYMYWSARPQYFNMPMTAEGSGHWRPANAGNQPQADAFKRIVTKEPKYQSEHPLRGVVKFGSQEYAFAMDVVPDAKKPDSKETTGKSVSNVATEPAAKPAPPGGKKPRAKPVSLESFSYNRLYFDFNHNGDLTDDKVVEIPADSLRSSRTFPAEMAYASFQFPRIDVTLDLEGTKLDYSFDLGGYAYSSSDHCQVMVSVTSAVCREGDISLEGKRHHIVVLDSNSNGRFDDESKIAENIHMASGQLYPQPGDMLLIDPKAQTFYDSPYDPTDSDYRYYVSKIISIDGRWYDLKISPAGDKLTLTPSTVPVGNVTNRNEAFRALIYDQGRGLLKICGTKGTPIPVPEGQWKLLSYTITHASRPPEPAAKAAAKAAAEKTAKAKSGSLLALFGALVGITDSDTPRTGPSLVSATATEKYKAVTVARGETVELPFGPPYTPTVTAMSYGTPAGQPQQTYLEMSLVGVCGEMCTNMMVKGGRPGKPDFTITDPEGKVGQEGSFEYG